MKKLARFSLPIFFGIMVYSIFIFKFHHGEEVAEHNGNFTYYTTKIYKTDAGALTEETVINKCNPLDLSITKSVIILGIAILMFVLFTGLAKSYTKNNGSNRRWSFL
jgi:F-type H+-transporting ATPase subunit a